MEKNGQSTSSLADVAPEKLCQPSIFDTDQIKELKGILQDVILKIEESQEQEKINEELDQIKK